MADGDKTKAQLLEELKDLRQRNALLERAEAEGQRMKIALAEQTVRDSLTQLYNRSCFNDRVKEEISRADRNGTAFAILLCDLDHFKTVNHTLGNFVGDEILKEVARRLQEASRGADVVFRWGGDQFIVLLSKTTREGTMVASNRIRQSIQQVGRQTKTGMEMSIGVSIYPGHGTNSDELIRMADRALHIAKSSGRKIHLGNEEYRLDDQTIKVVFQTVVDLRSDRIMGYEALSRDAQGRMSIRELFKKY
jgi:diguanylate cyclase (GGDEF)-like protein